MKLLFVIGGLQGGGAERVLSTLCNNIADRGHDVSLVYSFQYKDYVISPNVHEIDADSFEKDTFTGGRLKRYYNKVANRIRSYIFFSSYIKLEKPDVVISFLQNWAWQLDVICHNNNVPLVFSERTTFRWKSKSLRARLVKRFIYPRADMVTIMSYYDKAYLRDTIPHTCVMQNPLTYKPLSTVEYDSLFESRHNILACGRLTEVKGFDNLILAFSKVADDYPEWHLDIVGKDTIRSNYSEYLRELIKEKKLEDRIKLIGFTHQVNELMKKYSIFCLSSRHEGFPNALAEAMSMGCACVSFDIITGPREIIVDGLDGIIVEDQNIEELAKNLSALMADEKLRYNLGKKAVENIERFNADKMVDKWETMFQNLINNSNN